MSVLEPGDRVDRFEVEAFLGEGGLARVYRVRHLQLGSSFALKMLSFKGSRISNRLLREGRIQAQLRHPHVVTVLDVIEHEGRAGLLMEYVEGESLEQALNRRGAMPLEDALALFGQVLSGVAAAHDMGVLHRDLKPGNILLQPGSGGVQAKVTDFGIARMLSAEMGGDTLQTDVIGTPGYMAPEQASDPTSVDVRADLYSLGAVLYGMVTGRPPFVGKTVAQVLSDAESGNFRPVQELCPACPDTLARVIERCLAPDPDARFEDAHELAAALYGPESPVAQGLGQGPALGQQGGLSLPVSASPVSAAPASSAPMPTPRPAPVTSGATAVPLPSLDPAQPSRRPWGPILGGAGAVLGVLALAAVLLWPQSDPPPPDPVQVAPVEPAPAPTVADPVTAPADPAEAAPVETLPAEATPAGTLPVEPAPVAQAPVAVAGPSHPVPSPVAEPAPVPELPAAEPVEEDAVALAEPTPPPEAAPAPPPPEAPPAPSLAGSWSGKLGGRPSRLRVLEQRGGQVKAELEVLMGTAYRTFALSGNLDRDRMRLEGVDAGGWKLDVKVSGDVLEGTLTPPGKDKGNPWRATRE